MFLDKHGDGVRIRVLIEASTRFSLQVTIFGGAFGFGPVATVYRFYGSRGVFAGQREIEPRCILPPQVASSIFFSASCFTEPLRNIGLSIQPCRCLRPWRREKV